ncbi:UTRA domain-containing protein [Spirillospora sp. CA-294931]|uniref:UTRA domain-containing protein n=1 Tax=Spirillospora sp. CA-294931 TaxID=3240042 RepID=UPI003D913737
MATLGQKRRSGDASTGGTPALYRTIREHLIRDIRAGTYPPGSLLPSRRQIEEHWGVSAATSKRVLGDLAEQGWAVNNGTRGYTATNGPTVVDDIADIADTRRDSDLPQTDQPATDMAAVYSTGPHGPVMTNPAAPTPPMPASPAPAPAAPPRPVHTVPLGGGIPPAFTAVQQVWTSVEPLPPQIAQALRRTSGEPVAVRRRVITDAAGRVPVELRASFTPGVSQDNPLARPEVITEAWTAALATHLHQAPATASSEIHARHADSYEGPSLQLPPGAIVIVRATTLHAITGAPLDHTISVWPADSTRIQADNHPTT